MRTVFLTRQRQLELQQTDRPVIRRDTDVLLRIRAVGVCGSDVHYFREGRIGPAIVQYPWVVGHECCAVVEEVGPGVKNLRPGDRVAVDPLIWCGECDQCKSGREHTCRRQTFLGCPGQAWGSMSDYIVMPAASLFKVPDRMTDDQVVVAEPLSIGLWAIQQALKVCGTLDGARVGILGSGPVGLCVLLCLQALCRPQSIFVTDLLDERLQLARRCGADWVGRADQGAGEAIEAQAPLGLDCILECAGKPPALDDAVRLLAPGGALVLIGIPESDRISLDINLLRRKELVVQNVRRQNRCVEAALDLVASGKVDVLPLVTHHFPLEKSQEAFDLVAGYRDGVVKTILTL